MNLNEIELTKHFRTIFIPRKILKAAGWEVLGSGVDAAVARHPNREYVLKLFPSDNPYIHFVEYAQQHKENPPVPRFSRYVRSVPGTDWSYVRMEELTPIGKNTIDSVKILIKQFPSESLFIRFTELKQRKFLSSYLEKWDNKLTTSLIDGIKFGKISYQELCKKLDIQEADSEWQKLIVDLVNSDWGMMDLHPGNIMLRDKTLVVTDPVTY
jgi:hypothetical protein